MPLDQAHRDYLVSHHMGRLATIAPNGTPQNKPVGYHYNPDLGTIDIAGFNMETSAKYHNIAVNPDVSFVVDDSIGEGAEGQRFVEVRGSAEQAEVGSAHIIRIRLRRIVSWNIGEGPAKFQRFSLSATRSDDPEAHPTTRSGEAAAETAAMAVMQLVEELQHGLDTHDAEVYNRHFAEDVLWGSPYGATVMGYDDLHAIHTRLLQQQHVSGTSRYEIVNVRAPAPSIVLAQVRRDALDASGRTIEPSGDPAARFSEMALYVLARRAGQWWLVAGQNTAIRPAPTGGGQQRPAG